MKKSLLSFLILPLLLTFSCKKHNSSNQNSASSSFVSSVTSYISPTRIINSFTYDSAHRLTQCGRTIYDTSAGLPYVSISTVSFSYTNGMTPSSYTRSEVGFPDDIHQLSYDDQGRIVKDSSISGSGYLNYYSYSDNRIVSTNMIVESGTLIVGTADTLFLTNGNVGLEHVDYTGNPGLSGTVQYTFAPIANPTYHAAMSDSIGPLITMALIGGFSVSPDFISKNVIDRAGGTGQGYFGQSLSYGLSEDSKGRLSQITAVYPQGTKLTWTYDYY
jgi:hypothetical protein